MKTIIENSVVKGKHKCQNCYYKTAILAMFAGGFIALAAWGSLVASASIMPAGLAKLIMGLVFPVGLILVIELQGELFTGNCLLVLANWKKEITNFQLYRNLVIVWFFNLIGALLVAGLLYLAHAYHGVNKDALIALAQYKLNADVIAWLVKGIGCNILVAGAVMLAYKTKDHLAQVVMMYVTIMLFIVLGFDHCVANMFYFPAALMAGADFSLGLIIAQLLVVTVGNFIGGAIILCGGAYLVNKD